MKDFNEIFREIKTLLEKYVPPLTEIEVDSIKSKTHYTIVSIKEVVINGKKRDEMYFAALIIQKGFVGFYFMPTYTHVEIKKVIDPSLLKMLKGKSCYHIKELTPDLKKHIKNALDEGFKIYKKKAGSKSTFFVYIVECKDKSLYSGITTDLERRVLEHNSSLKGAKYTKMRRPVILKYSEKCKSRSEALKREFQIKQMKREEKVILIG